MPKTYFPTSWLKEKGAGDPFRREKGAGDPFRRWCMICYDNPSSEKIPRPENPSCGTSLVLKIPRLKKNPSSENIPRLEHHLVLKIPRLEEGAKNLFPNILA